jgi:uncharacterized protein YecT (DUF1311 family)
MSGLVAVLIATGVLDSAAADPLIECGMLTGSGSRVLECLQTQIEVSTRAMEEVLGLARAKAQELDAASGTEAAVLAVEASQQAWVAFRDTNCELRGALAVSGSDAEAMQLACHVEMTRERMDELLRLAGGGT